jgi:hypothetical protein
MDFKRLLELRPTRFGRPPFSAHVPYRQNLVAVADDEREKA